MDITTFDNGRDIDELIAEGVRVDIVRSGDARYDLTVTNAANGTARLRLRTSRRGAISTGLRGDGKIDEFAWTNGSDGNLQSLRAERCAVHLEHMSRGHYWMQVSFDGDAVLHIDFTTRGYLKCERVELTATAPARLTV